MMDVSAVAHVQMPARSALFQKVMASTKSMPAHAWIAELVQIPARLVLLNRNKQYITD